MYMNLKGISVCRTLEIFTAEILEKDLGSAFAASTANAGLHSAASKFSPSKNLP